MTEKNTMIDGHAAKKVYEKGNWTIYELLEPADMRYRLYHDGYQKPIARASHLEGAIKAIAHEDKAGVIKAERRAVETQDAANIARQEDLLRLESCREIKSELNSPLWLSVIGEARASFYNRICEIDNRLNKMTEGEWFLFTAADGRHGWAICNKDGEVSSKGWWDNWDGAYNDCQARLKEIFGNE